MDYTLMPEGGSSTSEPVSDVELVEPKTFDEVVHLVDLLRKGKAIILNAHLLDDDQAERIVDFLAGSIDAIGGTHQRIGNGVFLFAPASELAGANTTGES